MRIRKTALAWSTALAIIAGTAFMACGSETPPAASTVDPTAQSSASTVAIAATATPSVGGAPSQEQVTNSTTQSQPPAAGPSDPTPAQATETPQSVSAPTAEPPTPTTAAPTEPPTPTSAAPTPTVASMDQQGGAGASTQPPSISSGNLDDYIKKMCGDTSSRPWEAGESLKELSDGLGFLSEAMSGIRPPREVSAWHDARISLAVAMKETIDEYLDNPAGRTEDDFLVSMFTTLLPEFEPVQQAIDGMDPDTRTRMAEGGCLD
ncbi:MAG: hypothetical protein OXE87_11855 [Chloroflexi bacterium]|nr:hypothetical protein [Chloroflexota bacterium]